MVNNLTNGEIKELIETRIPYFINSMLAHDLMMYRKENGIKPLLKDTCYGDSPVIDPAFELGPIFGRVLLNFIGISADNNYTSIIRKRWRDNDLKIIELGAHFKQCDINHHIITNNKLQILTMFKLADKCIAHLTNVTSQESDHPYLRPAKIATCKLVLEHVHGIRRDKIWWIKEVSSL